LAIAVGVSLLALVAHAGAAEAKRDALVIGNSAYEHTRVLPNARNDARLIADLLRKMGFAVTEAGDLGYRRDARRRNVHFSRTEEMAP
jgi:hypothetical protein